MFKSGQLIIINDQDNVGVAFKELKKGEEVLLGEQKIVVKDDIPIPYKIALKDLEIGDKILKYGLAIGTVIKKISQGELVHLHNIRSNLENDVKYEFVPEKDLPITPLLADKMTFMGYRRATGEAGTRNHIYILPTVFCANGFCARLARIANEIYPKNENFDGFVSFSHFSGCCEEGQNLKGTQEVLASLAKNPNAGAVLFVSVGCETNNLDSFKPVLGELANYHIRFVHLQEEGDEIKTSLLHLEELYRCCGQYQREECPASKLVLAMNCGGSDGFSGITANPLLGEITDIIDDQGGSVVLTEVPEMFGVEQNLMNRSATFEVYEDIVKMICDYKQDYLKYGVPVYTFPTDANNKGGITTLEEKSLGCIEKGGRAKVRGVIPYGKRLGNRGLNLLAGPAHDFVSVTGQIAAGANLVLFTTGRGTPTGFAVPTIKITSNSELFYRKPHWFEYDAGDLLAEKGIAQATAELLKIIIRVASGELKTKAELNGYFEMGILHNGITL